MAQAQRFAPGNATGLEPTLLRDGRSALVFPAGAAQGAEARWTLGTPLAPGWNILAIEFGPGEPGHRKLMNLDFIGEDGKTALLALDLYYAPDRGIKTNEVLAGVYLTKPALAISLKKNQRRSAPSTPILSITLTPGRPPAEHYFLEASMVAVDGKALTLAEKVGGGMLRAVTGKPVALRWIQDDTKSLNPTAGARGADPAVGQDDGRSFETPSSSGVCVFIKGSLKGLELLSGETPTFMLERRPELPSPVTPEYVEKKVIPLAGPATEKLELSIEGSGLDPKAVAMADYPYGARIAAVQTWDDGIEQDVRASGLLQRHGWKASFFFNKHSRLIERTKELEDLGMEVGAHSWSHPPYWFQTPRRCYEESYACRTLLEEKTGHPVIAYAYPFNYGAAYDVDGDYVLRANREAGFLSCRSTLTGPLTLDNLGEPLAMRTDGHFLMGGPKLENAWKRATNSVRGIFYIWGHTYEIVKDADWAAFEEMLKTYGNRSEAWYASQGDLSVWKWMREHVTVTATGTASKLSLTLERPALHPWWAARVPVALKLGGEPARVSAGGKAATLFGNVAQVKWK